MMNRKIIYKLMLLAGLGLFLGGCSDSDSYSTLLKKEEKAANWFLSNQKVCLDIPADGQFEIGENAPFYKLDEDGYVYMQVVNPGSETSRPQKGDQVYFRYNRINLKTWYESGSEVSTGNDNNMEIATSGFVYDDYSLNSTIMYGRGIQNALSYLGYNSEVNLVLRSYYGFTSDQSQCIPYLINIRYFKAEY